MAHKRNTNGRLEDALASMLQAQASMLQAHASLAQNQATFLSRISEIDARMADTNRLNNERFGRIETILMDLVRMIERLPEAVRDKIGFRGATPPAPQ